MTIKKPKPLAEYKTPWEEKGEEFDPEKGKSFIHYLHSEAWKAMEDGKATETRLKAEKEEVQRKLDEKLREGESEADRIKRELAEAQDKLAKAGKPDVDKLKLEVALDKGLTKFQAKRLVGETREELEADADDILENMLPAKKEREKEGEEEERGDEGGDSFRITPQTRLRNPADERAGEGTFDFDKFADEYVAGRSSFG